MTLQEKIEYIGQDKFVKFTNTDDFPQLSNQLRIFLKEIGIYSNRKGYPYLTTDGKLVQFDENIIQFGKTWIVEHPFCIDIKNNERIIGIDPKDNDIRIVNSSIEKYIECLYITYHFSRVYESGEKFGPYHKNHKKYAKELLKMFEKIEPKAMEYPTWGGLIEEMDLGII